MRRAGTVVAIIVVMVMKGMLLGILPLVFSVVTSLLIVFVIIYIGDAVTGSGFGWPRLGWSEVASFLEVDESELHWVARTVLPPVLFTILLVIGISTYLRELKKLYEELKTITASLFRDLVTREGRAGRTQHQDIAAGEEALRNGQLGKALKLYWGAGELDAIVRHHGWYVGLGRAPEFIALEGAVAELVELRRNVEIAKAAGVAEKITGASMIGIQNATAELLWSRADLLATVQAYGIADDEISKRIEREITKLDEMKVAIRSARVTLAKATLADGAGRREWEQVRKEFRHLSHLTQAMEELEDEGL